MFQQDRKDRKSEDRSNEIDQQSHLFPLLHHHSTLEDILNTTRPMKTTTSSLLRHACLLAIAASVGMVKGEETAQVKDDANVIIQWNQAIRDVLAANKLVSSNVSSSRTPWLSHS